MKALLLAEDDGIARLARFYLRSLGFEVLRYRNPLKAIDNLEEIEPDALVVSARDFPRHWKTITQAIRSERGKDSCVIVILKGELFGFDEAAKAVHLGVNGVVRDDLSDRKEQAQFQRLLKRYVRVEEARIPDRVAPSAWDRLDFIFAHPVTLAPIAGRLETINIEELEFTPENPGSIVDLEIGRPLEDCSLRAGDRILSLSCAVIKADRTMILRIASIDDGDRDYLRDYLAACPEREALALTNSSE
ncbi:MAG: PilZ domain-containing protein [Spirochaetaceae bacterium]|nr:PilZ domain-containing protein [Spirochaetaceae bacterium]